MIIVAFSVLFLCCTATALGIFQDQCFLPGECVNSYSIEIVNLADEYECLSFCQDQELCQWFTFFPNPQACQLFINCTSIDDEACIDCLSGERNCEVPEPQCWIPGKCEGTSISSKVVESEIGCLRFCKEEFDCKWFTFIETGKMCYLFSECETFDETIEGCTSGERRCKEDVTTTSVTTTSTTTSTTTAPPFPDYSKVLVALGDNIADVEIVDLSSSETTCQKPEIFPEANYHASGGLGFQEKPLICGGINYNNKSACYLYEDGTWKSSDSLNKGRYGFAMTKSPFQDGSSKLFLSGGFDGTSYLSSSEKLTENGWQMSVSLPIILYYHCMVNINSTAVMVIGGKQISQLSRRSFLFNSGTNMWTEGPALNTARYAHGCGLIRQNSQTQDKTLIVVGGLSSSRLNSVEVLDFDLNVWSRGPDLPLGIEGAAMVEDPAGGVVLIGGNDDKGNLNTLYQLPHAGSNATWKLMKQKLKTKRSYHTAFLIPNDVAICN